MPPKENGLETPSPRYARPDSAMIVEPTSSVENTMVVGTMLGIR